MTDNESSDVPRRWHQPDQGTPVAAQRASHQPDHLHLLAEVGHFAPGAPRSQLSGVVVPSSRPADRLGEGLGLAARIAQNHGSQLLVIRSGAGCSATFPRALLPRDCPPIGLVNLPGTAGGLIPVWKNARHPLATSWRTSNLALKRNIGLVVGVLCGWETALMLDDDISVVPASQIGSREHTGPADPSLRLNDILADFAAEPLLQVAAFVAKDFNDNSVVCHGRTFLGEPQGGFVSGSCCVIRLSRWTVPFPACYNEDWMAFGSAILLRGKETRPSRSVKMAGFVHQLPYDPYSPKRAKGEEFGDLLAEAFFALLSGSRPEVLPALRSQRFWEDAIWRRQKMINGLLTKVHRLPTPMPGSDAARVEESLRAALSVYGSSREDAAMVADYVRVTMDDLEHWQDFLCGVVPAHEDDRLTLPEALEVLGLPVEWIGGPGRRTHAA